MSVRSIGNGVASFKGSSITTLYAVPCLKPGDVIRLSVAPDGPPRIGRLTVTKYDAVSGLIECDTPVMSAIPSAAWGDHILVEETAETDGDHAVLVAYLLSAVRRKDWHAVSDAANDLRVLEAKRG